MLPFSKKIILASQSPRRRELLLQSGFDIEVRPLDIPEDFPADMDVFQVAPYLAEKKAAAYPGPIGEQEVLLTADSVVIVEGLIYNKPADYEDAIRMLGILSGKMHTVITGVCLKDSRQTRVFAGESRVVFAPLTEEEKDFYVSRYQPYDKAGAYAVQEWIGLCKIQRIEGTYSNIMGLPMELVYEQLKYFLP